MEEKREREEQNSEQNLANAGEVDGDFLGDDILYEEEDEKPIDEGNMEEFREKIRTSGVVYLSYIPEGMTASIIRQKFQPYGISKVFLVPDENKGKRQVYKEGWCEFPNKLYAKLCEYELNGEPIGGTKKMAYREELWSIKYLHKFKWGHLMEKQSHHKKLREQRMNAEIAQARRENNFIAEKFEKSRVMKKMAQKRKREDGEQTKEDKIEAVSPADKGELLKKEFKRKFKQKQPLK